jgi:hypothetical protein
MSQPPAWLGSLVDEVGNCVEARAAMGPLGYRWREESGAWDVIVYPTPVQLRGGEADGMIVSPGFSLDLNALLSRFDEVADVRWSVYELDRSPPAGQRSPLTVFTQGTSSSCSSWPSRRRTRNLDWSSTPPGRS